MILIFRPHTQNHSSTTEKGRRSGDSEREKVTLQTAEDQQPNLLRANCLLAGETYYYCKTAPRTQTQHWRKINALSTDARKHLFILQELQRCNLADEAQVTRWTREETVTASGNLPAYRTRFNSQHLRRGGFVFQSDVQLFKSLLV